MSAGALFRSDTPNDFPRLERLFEMAKADFWNESTVIDWDRPLELPQRMRAPLARILSIVYYGERAALEVASQLIPMVQDEQAKFALAAQVIEEAKHVSVFRRLLTKLDRIYPVNTWSRLVLADLVRTRHPAAKLIGMQLLVENFANHLFHYLGKAIPDPHVKEVLAYVERDEKKHTGLAAIYLPTVLGKLRPWEIPFIKAKQMYWGFCLERTTYAHRHDATALGIDLYEAMQRVLRAQDKLVAEMGTRRGIWKSRTLERMSLSAFRQYRDRMRAAT
ncbi:MAG TPA: ferritin-like domain-containing protein [Kofleriaceae bacterium]|nr:ferritin-like domain-containing protein [Kofleriaceae bacterium]